MYATIHLCFVHLSREEQGEQIFLVKEMRWGYIEPCDDKASALRGLSFSSEWGGGHEKAGGSQNFFHEK